MKIALFIAPPINYGGGAEKYFITLANAMAERSHQVGIINLDQSFDNKLTLFLSIFHHGKISYNSELKYRYTDTEITNMLNNVSWIKTNFRRIKYILQSYDVIYAKNEILDLGILKLLDFRKLPPVITGIHTPIFYPIADTPKEKVHNLLYLSPIYKLLLRECALIHVPNSSDEIFISNHFSIPSNKVLRIFYPFDSKLFTPLKTPRNNNIFNILFVGRLTKQKGVDLLIAIIERLATKSVFTNMHFTIVGSGDLSDEVNILAVKYNNIDYLGHISPENMPFIYSSHDILLSPSRYEMLPWVCLEAQSCGIPVVSSNIPGPRDIIIDGQTGFLVEYSADEYMDKILYFYNLKNVNYNKYRKFRIQASEHIQSKFEPTGIYNQSEEMFEKVCE